MVFLFLFQKIMLYCFKSMFLSDYFERVNDDNRHTNHTKLIDDGVTETDVF